MKKLSALCVFLFALLLLSNTLIVAENHGTGPKSVTANKFASSADGFIRNDGQLHDQDGHDRQDISYYYSGTNMKIFLKPGGFSYEMFTITDDTKSFSEANGLHDSWEEDESIEDAPITYKYAYHRVDVDFIGANKTAAIVTGNQIPTYFNYYLAPHADLSNVPVFDKITYQNFYPNIDMELAMSSNDGITTFKYNFIVHPGGDVSNIQYHCGGNENMMLQSNGVLVSNLSTGKMIETIPAAYYDDAQRSPVNVSFQIKDNIVSFKHEKINCAKTFVIDPDLMWATYYGGVNSEEGRGLCTDSSDDVILIGRSNSTALIATAGAFQDTLAGGVDVIVSKYTTDCQWIWGTYLGGPNDDRGRGIVARADGGLYCAGHSQSSNLATPGAYQETFGGVEDATFWLMTSGGQRVWLTYYGGSDQDIARRANIDNDGNIEVIGYTTSPNQIATPGAHQTVYGGGPADIFLSKWTPDGTLIWGTYYGGTSLDHGRSVHTDENDDIVINGSTGSPTGIATPGAFLNHWSDGQDFVVAKFNTDGQIIWGTYYGGSQEDRGRGVITDSHNNIYTTGYTASDTGIATPGAFQTTLTPGIDTLSGLQNHDGVVIKWSPDGQRIWATYIGDTADDRCRSINLLHDEPIVGGTTGSLIQMATPNAYQPYNAGHDDMFIDYFDSTGNRVYGSYFGAESRESTLALAVDQDNNIYQVGTTFSGTGIATAGAAQQTYGGQDDCLLIKWQDFTVTGTPAIEDQVSSFNIYPNPCSGDFTVYHKSNSSEQLTIEVYNTAGKLVAKNTVNGTSNGLHHVSVQDISAGVYQCKILSADNTVLAEKKLVIIK